MLGPNQRDIFAVMAGVQHLQPRSPLVNPVMIKSKKEPTSTTKCGTKTEIRQSVEQLPMYLKP